METVSRAPRTSAWALIGAALLLSSGGVHWASAEEVEEPAPSRSSSVGAGLDIASDQYRALTLQFDYGIDSQWLLTSDLTTTGQRSSDATKELDIGADCRVIDPLSVRISGIFKRESEHLHAAGARPGMSWTVSSLWAAEHATVLKADLEYLTYRLDTEKKGLKQRSFTLGVTQEVASFLEFGASYSNYHYNIDPNIILSATGQTLIKFPEVEGVVSGFLRNSGSVYGKAYLPEGWDTSLKFSSSETKVGLARTKTVSISGGKEFGPRWYGQTKLSQTKSPGVHATNTISVDVTYSW